MTPEQAHELMTHESFTQDEVAALLNYAETLLQDSELMLEQVTGFLGCSPSLYEIVMNCMMGYGVCEVVEVIEVEVLEEAIA